MRNESPALGISFVAVAFDLIQLKSQTLKNQKEFVVVAGEKEETKKPTLYRNGVLTQFWF